MVLGLRLPVWAVRFAQVVHLGQAIGERIAAPGRRLALPAPSALSRGVICVTAYSFRRVMWRVPPGADEKAGSTTALVGLSCLAGMTDGSCDRTGSVHCVHLFRSTTVIVGAALVNVVPSAME